ncbi:MAG: FHA domain-containing protein [Anaerolineae bacterium]|nr:FHA domain-containing protein [Anaerolineae bacterium]
MPVYREDKSDVITILGRKELRPALDDTKRPIPDSIPETLYFFMPDGTRMALPSDKEIIIGRRPRPEDPPVTIDLENYQGHELGVSRQHALLKVFKGALILVDLDSVNGTYVNEQRAMPLKRYAILDGSSIRLGGVTIKMRFNP